jgi:hypothetical protein
LRTIEVQLVGKSEGPFSSLPPVATAGLIEDISLLPASPKDQEMIRHQRRTLVLLFGRCADNGHSGTTDVSWNAAFDDVV